MLARDLRQFPVSFAWSVARNLLLASLLELSQPEKAFSVEFSLLVHCSFSSIAFLRALYTG